MSFVTTFNRWLDDSIPEDLPAGVLGFAFNLTEVSRGEYEVELIGAERFDPDDEDWACEQIWGPESGALAVPSGEMGANWEAVLERASALVSDYLANGSRSGTLKKASGVGIGFVDGELQLLWPPRE